MLLICQNSGLVSISKALRVSRCASFTSVTSTSSGWLSRILLLELSFVLKKHSFWCFFCAAVGVFESIWMCKKVHSWELLIFHHPVCLTTSPLRKTHPWTIAFSEKYFLLFKCAFEKWNQNSPFEISFGICPPPFTTFPSLETFLSEISTEKRDHSILTLILNSNYHKHSN